jgi:D-alanine-D-alanine ligase
MKDFDPLWWQTIFDELYLVTDGRSVDNDQATCREVDFIVRRLGLDPAERILDLCGGQGRHALELARRGFNNLTVLDYSPTLLRLGREQGNGGDGDCAACFCRADARSLCLADRSLDCVLVLGNSFGYFRDDAENLSILREAARVLKPGGRLLMELTNKRYACEHLQRSTWHEAGEDILVCRERRLDNGGVLARELVLSRQRGLLRENRYFLRLFEPAEIADLLRQGGFAEVDVDDFTPPGTNPTHGMMASRMAVTAVRP